MLDHDIIHATCRHHNITYGELCEPRPKSPKDLTEAKENAAYLLSIFGKMSNEKISWILGYGTKQMAIMARKSVAEKASVNRGKADDVNEIISAAIGRKITINEW